MEREWRSRNLRRERTCYDSVWHVTLDVLCGRLELLAIFLVKVLNGEFVTAVTARVALVPAQVPHEEVKHRVHDDYRHWRHNQKDLGERDHV
jgi:hypothetical protein